MHTTIAWRGRVGVSDRLSTAIGHAGKMKSDHVGEKRKRAPEEGQDRSPYRKEERRQRWSRRSVTGERAWGKCRGTMRRLSCFCEYGALKVPYVASDSKP